MILTCLQKGSKAVSKLPKTRLPVLGSGRLSQTSFGNLKILKTSSLRGRKRKPNDVLFRVFGAYSLKA